MYPLRIRKKRKRERRRKEIKDNVFEPLINKYKFKNVEACNLVHLSTAPRRSQRIVSAQ